MSLRRRSAEAMNGSRARAYASAGPATCRLLFGALALLGDLCCRAGAFGLGFLLGGVVLRLSIVVLGLPSR